MGPPNGQGIRAGIHAPSPTSPEEEQRQPMAFQIIASVPLILFAELKGLEYEAQFSPKLGQACLCSHINALGDVMRLLFG
jgi:hypothetical protein